MGIIGDCGLPNHATSAKQVGMIRARGGQCRAYSAFPAFPLRFTIPVCAASHAHRYISACCPRGSGTVLQPPIAPSAKSASVSRGEREASVSRGEGEVSASVSVLQSLSPLKRRIAPAGRLMDPESTGPMSRMLGRSHSQKYCRLH